MTGAGWTILETFGNAGSEFSRRLRGIAIDSAGRIYLTSLHSPRMVRMNDMTEQAGQL
jgi:hypothetical protein